MKRISALVTLLSISTAVQAQQVRPANATQIYHELNQLKYLTNVLYMAAHPDDENTRMLSWLVNDQHIPTAYLSLTRGDGGQNILGPHLGSSLGLIRTHELLEARKIDGAQQFFSRAVDFGYSKTAEETFNHWDKKQLVHDAVFVIRKFKADVIICRFPPNKNAGHGQHAASAIVAHEAFNVSGDKTAFTKQLDLVQPWQPERILFNAYRFGSRNTTREDQFKLQVGQYNALLGMGYGELAGKSRSIHRSQGAGTRSVPGVQTEYLALVDGTPISKSMFDGIDITWGRVNRKDIGDKVNRIIANYDFTHPEKSLTSLLALYKEVKSVKDNPWKAQKLNELKSIILHCSGVMAELHTSKPEVVQGESAEFTFNILARSGNVTTKLIDFKSLNFDSSFNMNVTNDKLYSFKQTLHIPKNAPYTEPYYLVSHDDDPAHYLIPDRTELGLPKTNNKLVAKATIKIEDELFNINIPLSYKVLDPTHGDVIEQLRVVPDVYVSFASELIMPNKDGSVNISIHLHANKKLNNISLEIKNGNLKHAVNSIDLRANTDTNIVTNFSKQELQAASNGASQKVFFAQVTDRKENVYNKQNVRIKYEHLPTLQYYKTAQTKVLLPNWKCTAERIAYIEGAGDNVSEQLNFAGLNVEVLKEKDITLENLKNYDAVMVGIRAINVKETAPVWMPYLLQYTKEGGTLIMQYNTAHRMKTKDIGPYPIKLSYDRVTEEDAKMAVLVPKHRLFNYPNKITEKDFDNWVQERGLYFSNKWDDKYTPLFSTHDEGEQPLKGATLYTQYGKGHYIYTSLSFFRQLPAANTGALRLLCNFLSVGK